MKCLDILSDFPCGFRTAHPCKAQLISLVQEIHRSLDFHQVDLIMLDFRKAFDTVSHTHLLNKLLMAFVANFFPQTIMMKLE